MDQHLGAARDAVEALGLSVNLQSEICAGCRASVPVVVDGPSHPYIGASPGCWALYTVMLGREFSTFDPEVHRLSVDTYAAQHPGEPSRQAIQSVCVHLVALGLTLEHGWTTNHIRPVMGDISKGRFFEPRWLSPVPSHYPLTILDLIDAPTPELYGEQVWRWARSTWEAWETHHPQVREWCASIRSRSGRRHS